MESVWIGLNAFGLDGVCFGLKSVCLDWREYVWIGWIVFGLD